MFRLARARFGTVWSRVREKRLIGLFAFEFTVVVLGVLAAQGLQTWSRERELRAQTVEAQRRLERGFGDSVNVAAVWRAALPCLRNRVGDIMRRAAAGEQLDPELASRPFFPRMTNYSEPAETNARLAEMIGEEKADSLIEMPERIGLIQEASTAIAARWEVFRLLDPAFGPPGREDRAAARTAGAEILSRMRSIEAAMASIERLEGQLAVTDRTPFDPASGILPVRSCAELWAKGTAYRALEPSETPPR